MLVRELEKHFMETVHYSESKRILDIMDVLRVKRGPISGNRGPDSNPFFHREGLAIAAAFQPSHWQHEMKGLYWYAHAHGNRCL